MLGSIRGMNDLLPGDTEAWLQLHQQVWQWARLHGYEAIVLPLLERTALFSRGLGMHTDVVEKEMYSFLDTLSNEAMSLRPEGTSGCVRSVLEHHLSYNFPRRLWYWGPMFRHERPQKGRYRQFYQIGLEVFGLAEVESDFELITTMDFLWRSFHIEKQLTLNLNTIGGVEDRRRYCQELVAYLVRYEADFTADIKKRIHTNPLRILDSKDPVVRRILADAPVLMPYLSTHSRERFETLLLLLQNHAIPYTVDPSLVRGLDYYNDTVFEWTTSHVGTQNAVCAGGRYDHLSEQLGGGALPACGLAVGVERLLAILATPVAPQHPTVCFVHAIQGIQGGTTLFLQLADFLRSATIRVLFRCCEGSVSRQFKKAHAMGADFVIIMGDDELRTRRVAVKSMHDGHQIFFSLDDDWSMLVKKLLVWDDGPKG